MTTLSHLKALDNITAADKATFRQDLSRLLYFIKKQLNLSVQDMAECIGAEYKTALRILNGKGHLYMDQAAIAILSFGLTPEAIFSQTTLGEFLDPEHRVSLTQFKILLTLNQLTQDDWETFFHCLTSLPVSDILTAPRAEHFFITKEEKERYILSVKTEHWDDIAKNANEKISIKKKDIALYLDESLSTIRKIFSGSSEVNRGYTFIWWMKVYTNQKLLGVSPRQLTQRPDYRLVREKIDQRVVLASRISNLAPKDQRLIDVVLKGLVATQEGAE